MGVTPSPDRQALDRLIDAHRKLQEGRKPAPAAEEGKDVGAQPAAPGEATI